jgi:single-strand DNA-binding protein
MFQQLILIGNLGSDAELRYTADGTPVASFSLAVNRRWTKEDGSHSDEVTWFRVTVWRKTAESLAPLPEEGTPGDGHRSGCRPRLHRDRWLDASQPGCDG